MRAGSDGRWILADLVFVGRPHAAAAERTCELGPTEIAVSETGNATRHIPLSEITQVALSYMGTGDGQTYCNAKTRGRGSIHLRSHHYASLGNFEDRHETFDPFVAALCQRVAQQNPSAKFIRGSWLYFAIWFGVFLVSGALAVGLGFGLLHQFVTGSDVEPDLFVGAIVGGGVALTTFGAAVANRVKSFDPKDPPFHEDL